MGQLVELVDGVAQETGFAGVVRVDRDGEVALRSAYGLADRRHGIAMRTDSQLGTASGSKTLTALTVLSLVEDGVLELSTTARSLLGSDLPLIDDAVTVEQLLAHRSGIGDYLPEGDDVDVSAYALSVPVQELTTTAAFLPVLDGHPMVFPPGERFSYCNGGFVVLALLAERASGVGFHDLVRQRVCLPAGLGDTDFLRSDDLPGRAALGYVEMDGRSRTNVFHLPVLATGDGGMHTTVDDVHRFWAALLAGRIVRPDTVAEALRPRSDDGWARYGLGVWLHATRDDVAFLHGGDAGVSFNSRCVTSGATTCTVIGTTSDAAWPLVEALDAELGLA